MRRDKTIDGLTGFTSFSMSFGGKFFGGYRRDIAGTKGSITNMVIQTQRSKNSALTQSVKLQGIILKHCSYDELNIPENSIIYCDPPYADTTKYKDGFNRDKFWQWCRNKCNQSNKLFISECSAPNDFVPIWSKEMVSGLNKSKNSKKRIEKLFIHNSQLDTIDSL